MLNAAHQNLLTDLYELTMAAGFYGHWREARATFALFVRSLPRERAYLIAAGVDEAMDYLEQLSFAPNEIAYLRQLPALRSAPDTFFKYLSTFRFQGDVTAVAEGTVVFAGEPILQVSAPILQAQIAETYLLSVINADTLLASKAARVVEAAQGRAVVEFGTRRAQGPEAGLRAARAAYLAGCKGTSNVLAGYRWGIPVLGTAGHSWTQAFRDERESFAALLDSFPDTAYLLLDTYDTLAAARTVAKFTRPIPGVRLDSGDLSELSRQVRGILDRSGHHETRIMASGDLDEYKIAALVKAAAPIDSFGVGTAMATSSDAPSLNAVYKLVAIEDEGRTRLTTKTEGGKGYLAGSKQVFRCFEGEHMHHDVLAASDEGMEGAVPLLAPAMQAGKRVRPRAAIEATRARIRTQLAQLPPGVRALRDAVVYPVGVSPALQATDARVRAELQAERRDH